LIVLMIMHGRTSNTGIAILACCLASVAWAGANAVPGDLSVVLVTMLDSIRLSAWLLFAVVMVTIRASDGSGLGRAYLFGALAYCLFAIAKDAWILDLNPHAAGLDTTQQLPRIGFGVGGLLTIENLWRNTEPPRRWHVWPLCLAIGGLFAYELFLFSDAFITRSRVDPGLALGRALVAAFMTPLLALAMARNREWRIDIHVFRQVVLPRPWARAAVFSSPSPLSEWCCAGSAGIGDWCSSLRCSSVASSSSGPYCLPGTSGGGSNFSYREIFSPIVTITGSSG
jgi:hypothetical protein